MGMQVDRMHTLLGTQLPLDEIVVCPHDDADDCACRGARLSALCAASVPMSRRRRTVVMTTLGVLPGICVKGGEAHH